MAIEKLPDTPWHIGFVKKDENDTRRHKARCIHKSGDECGYYHKRCIGSAHCGWYAESEEEWLKVKKNNRTIEQEIADNIAAYKKNLEKQIKKYEKEFNKSMQYMKVERIRECPVCMTDMRPPKGSHFIQCKYCKAVLCDESYLDKLNRPAIVVGKKNPNKRPPSKRPPSKSDKVFIVKTKK